MKITKSQLKQIIKEEFEQLLNEKDDRCTRIAKSKYDVWPSAYASGAVVRCRKGEIWKDLKEEELTDDEEEELEDVKKELEGASKMHKKQAKRIEKAIDEGKKNCGCGQDPCITFGIQEEKKKAGTESSKESSLRDWFGRKGEKGSKGGWVDCNAPDGKGGYKACGREKGEKRSKYPACRPTPGACKEKGKGKSWGKKATKKEGLSMNKQRLMEIINEELEEAYNAMMAEDETFYEVDAVDINEEYCPVCAQMEEAKKKKPCKPTKGKRFAKRVDGKCVSHGQAGKAKDGGDRIRPGPEKADAYCARSAGIKKCKNPPCANTLSRKKWRCKGKKSMRS